MNLLFSRQSNLQQHTRVEEGKLHSNKVTLASPIQILWFILFDRSSGRQSPLTVEPSRNSEDDRGVLLYRPTPICTLDKECTKNVDKSLITVYF